MGITGSQGRPSFLGIPPGFPFTPFLVGFCYLGQAESMTLIHRGRKQWLWATPTPTHYIRGQAWEYMPTPFKTIAFIKSWVPEANYQRSANDPSPWVWGREVMSQSINSSFSMEESWCNPSGWWKTAQAKDRSSWPLIECALCPASFSPSQLHHSWAF